DVLAPAVVAPAGVALRVLVREHRALGLHHGERGEVLAGDHLQRGLLALQLGADRGVDLRIDLGEAAGEDGADLGVEHSVSDLSYQARADWYISRRCTVGRPRNVVKGCTWVSQRSCPGRLLSRTRPTRASAIA